MKIESRGDMNRGLMLSLLNALLVLSSRLDMVMWINDLPDNRIGSSEVYHTMVTQRASDKLRTPPWKCDAKARGQAIGCVQAFYYTPLSAKEVRILFGLLLILLAIFCRYCCLSQV